MANTPIVGIIMGSDSDLPVMQAAADILKQFNIDFELTVVSAHRTPRRMVDYAATAKERGLKVIIAGAGGAAHLPGMVASITSLPVIGVPIKSSNSIDGWDSVLSILQMPNGVPVATVALNAAKNAGILAAQIIGSADERVGNAIIDYKNTLDKEVSGKINKLKSDWPNSFDQ
jgi:5-(carboxyamino)imidazole ribonucleotide mutase